MSVQPTETPLRRLASEKRRMDRGGLPSEVILHQVRGACRGYIEGYETVGYTPGSERELADLILAIIEAGLRVPPKSEGRA